VKIYFEIPASAESLKIFTLNPKDLLSIAGGLYLVGKGSFVNSTHNKTAEKKENFCNIIRPRGPLLHGRAPVISTGFPLLAGTIGNRNEKQSV